MSNCIRIAIDNVPLLVQPDGIDWVPPLVAKAGNGAPIYGSFWACRLSNGVLTGAVHDIIFALMDGNMHTVYLPHPASAVMTTYSDVYIDTVQSRFVLKQEVLAVSGYDMVISRIAVAL